MVRIFTKAFSRYEWFDSPPTVEDYEHWLRALSPRIVLAIVSRELVGYLLYAEYRVLDVRESIYV